MNLIEKILSRIKKEEVLDILILGYFDNDLDNKARIAEFVPFLDTTIYIKFGFGYLRLHRKHTEKFELGLKLLDKKEFIKAIKAQKIENYQTCISSLSGMFFYEDRKNNFITKIEMYVDDEAAYQDARLKCLGLRIGNNAYVFFDPLSMHQMEIGKMEERNKWFEDVPNRLNDVMLYNSENLIFKSWEKE